MQVRRWAGKARTRQSRWVGQSGDGERRESQRASGGQMENDDEGAWGIRSETGEEGQRERHYSLFQLVTGLK